jgi:uncharacterized metal-binding protein
MVAVTNGAMAALAVLEALKQDGRVADAAMVATLTQVGLFAGCWDNFTSTMSIMYYHNVSNQEDKMMQSQIPNCVQCPYQMAERVCRNEGGKSPKTCPTITKTELIERTIEEYEKPDLKKLARLASIQEGEGYEDRELGYAFVKPIKPRIVEIIEFAKKMNYKRLGLAFCAGLHNEAKAVGKIFSSKGFELVSVICKVGRIPKEKIGVLDHEKIAIGKFEPMCNPILQALILNDEATDFNIMLGLCVGHDSLFFKYSEAPCTVLAVKDRVLGHNPLAAIYNIDSYYRSLKNLNNDNFI